jgi:hypothetical protein
MMGGTPQEHGEKIAEFSSYEGAQKSVSQLIASDIPAKDIAIVGRGLRSVETVTGRLGYAAAARTGAINGILLGLLFSAIFVLGTPNAAIQLFIGVMLVGIAVGMLMSIITYTLLRRRRDYTSITQLIADHYEITVLPRSIHRAREILGAAATHAAAAASASVAAMPPPTSQPLPPPQYGERIDPPIPSDPPVPPRAGDEDTTPGAAGGPR